MKIQFFILWVLLVFLSACTGGGGYQRNYIISDTLESLSDGDSH